MFVIFGEPDIDILEDEENSIRVRIAYSTEVCHPFHAKVAGGSTGSLPLIPWQGCHRSERSDAGFFLLLLDLCSVRQPCLAFTHGFSFQIDLVGVVDQAIEDGIGQRRIADHVMPFLQR